MRTSLVLSFALAALCAVVVLAPCRVAGLYSPLTQPAVISSSESNWAATITLEAARMDAGETVAFNTRLFCYQGTCSFPGPTIRVSTTAGRVEFGVA
jgi:hypothetical protein